MFDTKYLFYIILISLKISITKIRSKKTKVMKLCSKIYKNINLIYFMNGEGFINTLFYNVI